MTTSPTSGYLSLTDLPKIALGLNIEGYRPAINLPNPNGLMGALVPGCKWYNLIQVIDEPLCGLDWTEVMNRVKENQYPLIEQAVGIDPDKLIEQLVKFINRIKPLHQNLLIHVHQFTDSTVLDQLIQKATGIRTILDRTHYFEHPTIYSEEYPHIDGLISLSQCAGIGLKPGEWIVPDSWLEYDVQHQVIYTTKQGQDLNSAKEFVPFDHWTGSVLMVNDMWVPDLTMDPGVLLLDKLGVTVFKFVQNAMSIFDESHDINHVVRATLNATRINNTQKTLMLILLHDVCDHKYSESIPRSELSAFIKHNLPPDCQDVDQLIDYMSFSKRKAARNKGVDSIINTISDPSLDACRDGDLLDAIGQGGVERCIIYTTKTGGKIPEDVIVHCFDKLLRILPEGYIVTPLGKTMAKPKHNEVVQWVRDNLPKSSLKFEMPQFLE